MSAGRPAALDRTALALLLLLSLAATAAPRVAAAAGSTPAAPGAAGGGIAGAWLRRGLTHQQQALALAESGSEAHFGQVAALLLAAYRDLHAAQALVRRRMSKQRGRDNTGPVDPMLEWQDEMIGRAARATLDARFRIMHARSATSRRVQEGLARLRGAMAIVGALVDEGA